MFGSMCFIMLLFLIGLFGIIWYIFWLWLSFEKPSTHPTITDEELIYIENSLGQMAKSLPTVNINFIIFYVLIAIM